MYLACGPVEKLTGLWHARKAQSNQPRNAWTSAAGAKTVSIASDEKGDGSYSQSFRVATSLKSALKVRSALVTLRRSNVAILHGLLTTDRSSTVSTSGSRSAISLMHE